MDEDSLSNQIIGAAIEIHRQLGPGLLESAYEECLAYELSQLQLRFERQKPIPVVYKGVLLDCGFRLDLLVEGLVIVELKSVDAFTPIHMAQVLTYLKLTKCKLGLLLNFNVVQMRHGVKRVVFGSLICISTPETLRSLRPLRLFSSSPHLIYRLPRQVMREDHIL